MNIIFDLLFIAIIIFYSYRWITFLKKMDQNILLPTTDKEAGCIRAHPNKVVDFPTFAKNKVGIIIYSSMIVFVFSIFLISISLNKIDWTLYPLLILPLVNAQNLLNIFAVIEDGLLCGNRYIPWSKIKSYQFITIGINHKYYGFSRDVNVGYELKMKTKGFPISVIITSHEVIETLRDVFKQYGIEEERARKIVSK